MDALKIDRRKLKTVTNFAKQIGVKRQSIYAREKAGTIKIVSIDGVKFVLLD